MIYIMRMSVADNNYDASTYLPPFQNAMFFVVFLMSTFTMTIIFMNFIIAEVSNSYNVIKETLDFKLLQERGDLINESEDIMRANYKSKRTMQWNHLFPKYIIKRELDV